MPLDALIYLEMYAGPPLGPPKSPFLPPFGGPVEVEVFHVLGLLGDIASTSNPDRLPEDKGT